MGKVATTAQTKGRVKSAINPRAAKSSQKILRCMRESLAQLESPKSKAGNGCATNAKSGFNTECTEVGAQRSQSRGKIRVEGARQSGGNEVQSGHGWERER